MLEQKTVCIPKTLTSALNRAMPAEATAIGFVASNLAGEYLLVEPTNHFDNVSLTVPKVQRQPGESPVQALERCLREKVGSQPSTIYPVPRIWQTGHSCTQYFAGLVSGTIHPTSAFVQAAHWYSRDSALQRLQFSPNPRTRQRDMELLQEVSQICLTPEHRLLLAVKELHNRGFEQLRIAPALAPSGMHWRCAVVPKSCMSKRHGAIPDSGKLKRLQALAGEQCQELQHSSGNQQAIFGWQDRTLASLQELAQACLERSRELVFAGYGSDPKYVQWYERMLGMVAPHGVIYAMADWVLPEDHLPVARSAQKVQVPLPPN